MKIKINYSKNTGTIKQAFNDMFPFLKIEFFNRAHIVGQPSALKNMLKDEILLGEINPLIKEGSINIHPEDSVASLEQIFQQDFGLPVQVFRKQKDVWIETTKTDQLSLAEQNKKGNQLSLPAAHAEPSDRYLEDGQY